MMQAYEANKHITESIKQIYSRQINYTKMFQLYGHLQYIEQIFKKVNII